MESLHFFLKCIGTMNPRTARQRLGLRQSSGAFGWLASIAKAPEDWRTAPKRGGASDGSWKASSALHPCRGTVNRYDSPSPALRATSPPLREKDGMRGYSSWKALFRLRACIGTMNPPPAP